MITVVSAADQCVGSFVVSLIQGGSVASYSQVLPGHHLIKDDLFRHAWMQMRHSLTHKHTELI